MNAIAKAKLKGIKGSIPKIKLVADSIKGFRVGEALNQLQFNRKRASEDIKKLLEASIANAENNLGLDIDCLFVKNVIVEKSHVLKRFKARARGRGSRIIKPYSTVKITLEERL